MTEMPPPMPDIKPAAFPSIRLSATRMFEQLSILSPPASLQRVARLDSLPRIVFESTSA